MASKSRPLLTPDVLDPWLVCASQLPNWSMMSTLVGQLVMPETVHFLVPQPLGRNSEATAAASKPKYNAATSSSKYTIYTHFLSSQTGSRGRARPACFKSHEIFQKTGCSDEFMRPLRFNLRLWAWSREHRFIYSSTLQLYVEEKLSRLF